MPLVFAYGPDAYRARVLGRLGSCEVLGPGSLAGYALVFDKPSLRNEAEGFANLEKKDGASVHGVLYDLSRKQIETLEGYFGGYQRSQVKVAARKTGTTVDATVFTARRRARGLRPSAESLDLSLKGAEENGFPREFIDALRAFSPLK